MVVSAVPYSRHACRLRHVYYIVDTVACRAIRRLATFKIIPRALVDDVKIHSAGKQTQPAGELFMTVNEFIVNA